MNKIEEAQFVELDDVFATDSDTGEAGGSGPGDEDERPIPIAAVSRHLWDELNERVAAIRSSLVAGEVYGDGEICGGDWWLPQHDIMKYMIATCLREPRFLDAHGLMLAPVNFGCGSGFATRAQH